MNLSEYVNSVKDKKICVIGIGVSNDPLIRLLALSGCDVTAADRRTIEDMGMSALELINLGVKLRLGAKYLEGLEQFDLIFRTPGLMPFDEHLLAAMKKGAVVTSEMEVFFRLCPCRIIAVTGSDGKTTTTTIIAELLKEAGYTVHIGGNIGRPLLCDVPVMKKDDIAVLELSSFQLHSMQCRPSVSVITNISPNHLDKHKDLEDYINAKKSIYLQQDAGELLILNADDEHSPEFASEAKARIQYFSLQQPQRDGVICRDGRIYRACDGVESYIMNASDIYLPGEHNLKNFIAAFAATSQFVSNEVCEKVAKEFKGVEHRLETVRVCRGVTYINDSIGTSPTRTIAGLHALKTKPIVIAGGYDKDISFDALGDELCRNAKALFLTGDTADKIYQVVTDSKDYPGSLQTVRKIGDFDQTVLAASEFAQDGDIVLFSPACAAFDHFKNFAERGKHFKNLIMELEE